MKLKSPLLEIATVGLLVAFASSGALAQRADVTAAVNAIPRPAAPWTVNTVPAAQPFGDIDISGAGSSTESVMIWSLGRSAFERNELSGRCNVIITPGNAANYRASDQQFCRNYIVGSANQITPRS